MPSMVILDDTEPFLPIGLISPSSDKTPHSSQDVANAYRTPVPWLLHDSTALWGFGNRPIWCLHSWMPVMFMAAVRTSLDSFAYFQGVIFFDKIEGQYAIHIHIWAET